MGAQLCFSHESNNRRSGRSASTDGVYLCKARGILCIPSIYCVFKLNIKIIMSDALSGTLVLCWLGPRICKRVSCSITVCSSSLSVGRWRSQFCGQMRKKAKYAALRVQGTLKELACPGSVWCCRACQGVVRVH